MKNNLPTSVDRVDVRRTMMSQMTGEKQMSLLSLWGNDDDEARKEAILIVMLDVFV